MRPYVILFALILGSMANAATFLCPDGSHIFRKTTDNPITVTIDGTQFRCELTEPQSPDHCSSVQFTSGPNLCLGVALNDDCGFGKCFAHTGPGSIASDGYPVCGCGFGE